MRNWFAVTLAASVVVALVFGLVEIPEGQDGRRRDRGPRGPIADFPLTPLPHSVTVPLDNPQSQARVELGRLLFWDVRAQGLEAQALVPIITLEEMRGDSLAMGRAQIRGMQQFVQVGCINCHNGPMFSDFKLHVLGLRDNRKLAESDRGTEQTHAFRTPSLRNLAYTAPYMHNGILRTLDDVLEFYDDVGDRDERNINLRRDQIDPLIRNLDDVDDHEDEIIEFLEALNDDSLDKRIPERVPSGLNPGGRIG